MVVIDKFVVVMIVLLLHIFELYRTNIGIQVMAAIADNTDCRNHNLELEKYGKGDVDSFFLIPVIVVVVVAEIYLSLLFMNVGSNCCCCCCCVNWSMDNFDFDLVDDRYTVYHATILHIIVMNKDMDINMALINAMVSFCCLGQNIPSDVLDFVDIAVSVLVDVLLVVSTITDMKLQLDAVTSKNRTANEARMDVIHAVQLLQHNIDIGDPTLSPFSRRCCSCLCCRR